METHDLLMELFHKNVFVLVKSSFILYVDFLMQHIYVLSNVFLIDRFDRT